MSDVPLETLVARVICPRYPLARDGLDFGDGSRSRPLPGGFCVFRVALPAALDDLAALRAANGGTFPYACSDFERGVGQQVPGATLLPPPFALGATGDPELARAAGEATAREARDRGVAIVFAPVLDVADEPENPIVGTRAFASSPEAVARFATAWIDGARRGGAIPVAKHYPGHGATRIDSHLELPTIDRSLDVLTAVEEVPFRAALAEGLPAVMIGHLHVPALDPAKGVPATLSAPIVAGRLRGHLGFHGLVFTDALDMGAIPDGNGDAATEPAVRALLAGADVPLLPRDPHRAARAIRDAVREGLLPLTRLREAAERIEAAVRSVTVAADVAGASRPETAALAREIARRSVVRAEGAPPPDLAGRPVALTLVDDTSDPFAAPGLRAALARAGLVVTGDAPSDGAPLVVVLSDVRCSKGRVALPPETRSRLAPLLARPGAELLVAGPPAAVPPPERPPRTTFVFGTDPASLEAAAEVLARRPRDP